MVSDDEKRGYVELESFFWAPSHNLVLISDPNHNEFAQYRVKRLPFAFKIEEWFFGSFRASLEMLLRRRRVHAVFFC